MSAQLQDGLMRLRAEPGLRAQEGMVSSGNSLDYCQQDWDQMVASSAAIKEMEAAGIAWASLHYAATCLELLPFRPTWLLWFGTDVGH